MVPTRGRHGEKREMDDNENKGWRWPGAKKFGRLIEAKKFPYEPQREQGPAQPLTAAHIGLADF